MLIWICSKMLMNWRYLYTILSLVNSCMNKTNCKILMHITERGAAAQSRSSTAGENESRTSNYCWREGCSAWTAWRFCCKWMVHENMTSRYAWQSSLWRYFNLKTSDSTNNQTLYMCIFHPDICIAYKSWERVTEGCCGRPGRHSEALEGQS